MLRPLTESDFDEWHEVRTRCGAWLLRWEPRPEGGPGAIGGPAELRRPLRHP